MRTDTPMYELVFCHPSSIPGAHRYIISISSGRTLINAAILHISLNLESDDSLSKTHYQNKDINKLKINREGERKREGELEKTQHYFM